MPTENKEKNISEQDATTQLLKALRDYCFQVVLKSLSLALAVIHAKGILKEKYFIPISIALSLVATIYALSLSFYRVRTTDKNFEAIKRLSKTCNNILKKRCEDDEVRKKFIKKITEEVGGNNNFDEEIANKRANSIIKYVKEEKEQVSKKKSDSILGNKLFLAFAIGTEIIAIIGSTTIPILFKRDFINFWQYFALLLVNVLIGSILGFTFTMSRIKSSDDAGKLDDLTTLNQILVEHNSFNKS